ncbi:hypothetical protein A3F03_02145 [Candidatus Roizmanbacteria bacterium RIFCSPHIGHO2_12_FULL_41_11]|uniref:EamA domain-containing protein n=3 Tax=Candidatus Roizmaniibacteriota TaxID=1752723 RepID=A0A1F7JQX9_9BACT|nr:MAG: hypothetical protein A3F03_02145 [Candidatus Roizmanbacteria bacterium RIFCSPHIGHO2_12_FULL_41_11]OGK51142.1 MAG: hypothetical protein A2966_00170 [Candidatus Roizmanbacteria bacterium RIFCSPLOWO2_01_FULL_41_22]OGK58001.1 MAG: hypothetical protein A3H86_00720 [Candidatus Roizmanbacteria bacterium RIFCSPLOWO2_02_FULL_41_9]
MKKQFTVGPLLIIIAASLWAVDGVIRRSLFTLPPIIIVFYEHLIGAAIVAPFILSKLLKEKLSRREFILIAFVALLSGLFGTLWFTDALTRVNFIPFSVVFLLQKLQPIFAITTARLVLKEKIHRNYVKWALLTMIAAFFVTFPNGQINFQTGQGTIMAALLAVGAAFAWGSSTAFSKMSLLNKPNDVMTGMRFILTSIFALVAIFILGKNSALFTPSLSQFARFLLIAVTTGMVAILIYYKGLKNTQVKVATILELVYPLLAVFIDMFLYKTYLAPTQYLAALVMLFGVYKISQSQNFSEVIDEVTLPST